MKQHILVTGGAGFIGSHLVDALIQRDYEVTILDIKTAEERRHVHPDAGIMEVDLRTTTALDLVKALEPDVIVHLAANANVAKSVADPSMDAEINYLASVRLLDIAKDLGVKKFIFASTGGALSSEETRLPTPEDQPSTPLSPYAKHKLATEKVGAFFADAHGLPFMALRFANVYGPRQCATLGEANVIATFAERMIACQPTSINGTGKQTRDYVYIDDVVRAILLSLEANEKTGIYNIGSGTETSVTELHNKLSKLTGYAAAPEQKPAAPGEPQRSCLDVNKAWNVLGWSPTVSLDKGLVTTVDWYTRNRAELSSTALKPARITAVV